MIMSEWKKIKIGEIGNVVTGKTPSKNNKEDWGNEMLFITPSDYGSYGKKAYKSVRNLSLEGVKRFSNKILPPNSILVTCIGSDMGKVVMNGVRAVTNQQINSIIPNADIVNPNFAYYLLVELYETLKIYGGDGTAVPIVNKRDFENINIEIPPLREQKAIAEVLSSLDDKIDLLYRENQTLEQMAETLFRQWFVEETDEGWEWRQLDEFVEVQRGLSYKGAGLTDVNGGIPMHNLNSVYEGGGYKESGIKYYSGEYKNRHKVFPGDVIITNTEQGHQHLLIGYPAILPSNFGKFGIFSQHIFRLEIKSKLSNFYLFHLLKSTDVHDQIAGATNGSTVNMLPKDGVEWVKFKLPPQKVIDNFTQVVQGYSKKQEFNKNQIRTLTTLRDNLLPKLMSGEVKACF